MRSVLKSGRRYKGVKVEAALAVDGITLVDKKDKLVALEEHFAAPENGKKTSVQRLLEIPGVGEGYELRARDMFTLSELAEGFKSLKHDKAAGFSTIPAETYSGAAAAAAKVHWPVVLKSFTAGKLPLLWRGTRAIAIAKPHPQPEKQEKLLIALIGPGIIEANGGQGALVDYVRMMMRGSWFTTGARPAVVQHTHTGTVPGTPTADVLFQLAQSVSLAGLSRRLSEQGLSVKVHEQGEEAPCAAWADDVEVCTPCCEARQLLPKLEALVQEVEEGSREIGVRLNFDVNKTAALCVLQGEHSVEVRKQHLLVDKPAMRVSLRDGQEACVRLVDSYQHLGGVVVHNGSCLRDVESRKNAAQPVLIRLCKTLFRNAALTGVDNRELLNSLVIRKFLFASGHWVLRSKVEHSAAHGAVMAFYRKSCWAVAGCSSKLLRDGEICSVTQVLRPVELLHCERVRALLEIVGHGPGFVWDLQVDESKWLSTVLGSLKHVLAVVGRDWKLPDRDADCLCVLQCRVKQGAALLRDFTREVLRSRSEEREHAAKLAAEI